MKNNDMFFNCIIGIDQTGAVDPKGTVKPLFASLWIHGQLHVNLRLPCLSTAALKDLIEKCSGRKAPDPSTWAIAIDSVFGLPGQKQPNFLLKKEIKKTAHFLYEGKGWGQLAAHQFFQQYKESDALKPQRLAETLTNANSLFDLHPFQKNISCGTFRVWKELALSESNFSIWPFEQPSQNHWNIFEVYPSLFWRSVFEQKSRKPDWLVEHLENLDLNIFWNNVEKTLSPDAADATVACLGFIHFWKQNPNYYSRSFKKLPKPALYSEGWIFGLEFPS